MSLSPLVATPLGRFAQEEALGFADGPNLYRYASNGPCSLSDPSGNDPDWDKLDAAVRNWAGCWSNSWGAAAAVVAIVTGAIADFFGRPALEDATRLIGQGNDERLIASLQRPPDVGRAAKGEAMVKKGMEILRKGRLVVRGALVVGGLAGGYAIGSAAVCIGDTGAYGP
jgi:hypothetical protein